jgi:hypothetical protein
MERRWAAAAITLLLVPPAGEPIRIFVTSSAKGEPSVVETIDVGRDELEKRIRKKKRSFLLVPSREEAEIVIDLMAYWIREEMNTRNRVYVSPDGNHENGMGEVEEHHSLLAIVTLFGAPREMTGVQTKPNGADVKGAARYLLEQIERYLRDHPRHGEARTASVRNGP